MADAAFTAIEDKVRHIGECGDVVMDTITDLNELSADYLRVLGDTLSMDFDESHTAVRRALEAVGAEVHRSEDTGEWEVTFPLLEEMVEKTQEFILWALFSLRKELDAQQSSPEAAT